VDPDGRVRALSLPREPIDPSEIIEVVESVMASVSGDLSAVNQKLYHEIESLARFIQVAKSEIASLSPEDIKHQHIAAAADELSVIVENTEVATNSIFEAVEAIEAVCPDLDPVSAEKIINAVTTVYEACSFQDITGQRISKVVGALQHIEQKLSGLLEAFGGEFETRVGADGKRQDLKPIPKVERPDEHLMNGPQSPGAASTQDEIDALLGFD
jgi:chemotaxis protein CheZ